jgi:hypothetical protein
LSYKLANAVVYPTAGKELEYMVIMKDPVLKLFWQQGLANEIGRPFQGIRDIQGTNIMMFI